MTTLDELIKEYATQLWDIYDRRLAGDYTFEGVLATFLMELDNIRPDARLRS